MGSREKAELARSGNGGMVVGWFLCPEPVVAPDIVVQRIPGLKDWLWWEDL